MIALAATDRLDRGLDVSVRWRRLHAACREEIGWRFHAHAERDSYGTLLYLKRTITYYGRNSALNYPTTRKGGLETV